MRHEQLNLPPQSIEAEQAVLGGIMLAPDALDDVADILREDMFYRRDHQLIFHAIQALKAKDRPYDAVTIGEWFESQGLVETVAGGAYLVELASTTPSAANVRAYAEIVADKALLRRMIDVGSGLLESSFQPGGRDSTEILAETVGRLNELNNTGVNAGGLSFVRSNLKSAFEDIAARYEGRVSPGLVPPWKNVAEILPGLENTDFMVLAARPGMGKTVAGLEFADEAASQGRNVAFFSLEMGKMQLTQRLISRRAVVDGRKLRQEGAIEDEEWAAITQAIRDLKELPLAIDDEASVSIAMLGARARRMHAKVPGGVGLVVVDYVQLMSGSGKSDSRREEVDEISRGMKLLAKELKCPVIGLSQLNRSLETRADKRPVMADLRESGGLEQDADVVAFLYRDDYYTKDECGAPGIAEFIIGKQRNGPTGTAYLRHQLECSRFLDYHGSKPFYGKTKGAGRAATTDGFDDEVPMPRHRPRSVGSKARARAGSDA